MQKKTLTSPPPLDDLQQFQEWLEAGKLPEVQPSLQPRSIKNAWLLIQAGKKLLNDRSLTALSIEDVCAEAGTTVGGFYGRFTSKLVFFQSIQRVVILESEQRMQFINEVKAPHESTLNAACFDIVNNTVDRFRQNYGVIKASLQHADEGAWEPFKQIGRQYRVAIALHLAPYLTYLTPQQLSLRIQFAHQSMIGVLTHVILHNPGVVNLDDEALIHELTLMLCTYLSADSDLPNKPI